MQQASDYNQAKNKFNRAYGLMVNATYPEEYPSLHNIQGSIQHLESCLHWGQEMIRHGATRKDFDDELIISMLGIQKVNFRDKVIQRIRAFLTR